MRTDPQRIVRLAVLIQHGSFSRAATHLGLSQPALSQSIAQIEKEVGVKLIERTPHGIEPTIYGRMLYQHAKSIDRELALAAQDIAELAFGRKDALRIGATVGGASALVVLAICRTQDTRPGIDSYIVEDFSIKPLLAQLHDRTVDVLMCQNPQEIDLKGTRSIALCKARRVACVRATHPLSGVVSLNDLATYPFVCPQEELGLMFGFRQIFATIGVELPEVLAVNSLYLAKEIVLNSDSFALFSELSVINERDRGLFRLIELDVMTEHWLQIVVRAEQPRNHVIEHFVKEIIAVCGGLHLDVHADAVEFAHV
jgi:DNA-binding transcriptional LysR family regulator